MAETKCMQLAENRFMFEIITESRNFLKYTTFAKKYNLVKDVCCFNSMDDLKHINEDTYLNVIQKSPLWLHLRSLAAGTASSVGKYIKGPPMYPTMEQVSEAWYEKVTFKPFTVTHSMAGHMQWGVKYEDPALVHFACENHLAVAQVGTINLPLKYILSIAQDYLNVEELKIINDTVLQLKHLNDNFLVSPDGVIGEPDDKPYNELPEKLYGMLEIKCISPFHHMESATGHLTWVDDMEKRQWFKAKEIPYVYVTQICMQAISGLLRLNMNRDHTMWFIRWSPVGFSEFKISFYQLVKMGIASSVLFLKLKHRISCEDDLPFKYLKEELPLVRLLEKLYNEVTTNMKHRYVDHGNLYEGFKVYHKVTESFNFKVPF